MKNAGSILFYYNYQPITNVFVF